MKIITVSREYGSGGRELGRRLAEQLGFEYYDREIISAVAANRSLDEDYVSALMEHRSWRSYPLHYRSPGSNAAGLTQAALLLEQKRVIEAIAATGRDSVIVGRNADVLLREHDPFNIFVCAEHSARLQRRRAMAQDEGRQATEREIARELRNVDRARAQSRAIITDSGWGDPHAYHLTVNTTGWDLQQLAEAIATLARARFGATGEA